MDPVTTMLVGSFLALLAGVGIYGVMQVADRDVTVSEWRMTDAACDPREQGNRY